MINERSEKNAPERNRGALSSSQDARRAIAPGGWGEVDFLLPARARLAAPGALVRGVERRALPGGLLREDHGLGAAARIAQQSRRSLSKADAPEERRRLALRRIAGA